jgi:hypothetical protein
MKYSRLSTMTIVANTMVFYDCRHGNLRLSILMTMTMASDCMVKVTSLIQLHNHVVMGSR